MRKTLIGAAALSLALVLTACPPSTNPPPAGQFVITVVFTSTVSQSDRAVFASAASKWAQAITGDLDDITGETVNPNTVCGATGLSNITSIDDVVVVADVKPIDGPGGTLGRAGPALIRLAGTKLPALGCMEFDSADLADLASAGQLQETITHEMGHVLGFGTLWKTKNLLQGAGASGSCGAAPTYTGASAKAEYATLGGSGNIPVEGSNDGSGPGTCDSHWRETTFGNELMTGYLDGGVKNPLSRMSIAGMKDLGYVVNLNAAEAYTKPASASSVRPESLRSKLKMMLLEPVGTLP